MTLIVGDVHGCAEELERMLQHVGDADTLLIGDLYTKGPDPAGVYRLVRDHDLGAVLGNHDLRLRRCLEGRRPKDTHGHEVIAALDAFDPGWRDHLASLPLFVEVAGCTLVHAGLHPSGELEQTTESMAVSMRTWPAKSQAWWGESYEGARRVVYGHDARRGLQRHDHVLGLDTGCVYGGVLTGWLVEEDRLIQIPAARVYCSVG